MAEPGWIETQVRGLRIAENTRNPVVILQEVEGERMLPIYIGHPEASAIAMTLAGRKFERPLTHDLMRLILEGLQASLQRVAVTELRTNTFYAKLVLERDHEIVSVDARPSDSIALALRMGAPIFVAEGLLREPGSEGREPGMPDRQEDVKRLRDYLEGMNPEDFGGV